MIEDGYDSRQVMGNTKGVSSSAPGLLSRASGRTDGGARALLSRGRGGGFEQTGGNSQATSAPPVDRSGPGDSAHCLAGPDTRAVFWQL